MKKSILFLLLFSSLPFFAQTNWNIPIKKKIDVQNDTIQISTVSISSYGFKVLSDLQTEIDTAFYTVNFSLAQLILKPNLQPKPQHIIVEYTPYPDFITKTYSIFNKNTIVPSGTQNNLFKLTSEEKKTNFTPFNGLTTSGNITRGLTVGNNQNGVTNSSLDLQIAGKLSDKVTLKAAIIDTNLPIQEQGNTYQLNEFDAVFLELLSDSWKINAGDVYLKNTETSFLRFNKKVAGLSVEATIKGENNQVNLQASGAIVKGKYKKVQFNGQEGNQGPYQLSDVSNSYILILSNTEQIYVNGILLKRGEAHDYVIDYNTAEITFSTTFPITASMRITAEYQYTDQVYTRFVTYNHVDFESEKLQISGYFYNESDLKNQPLSQDVSNEQKQLLANAGNNPNLMVVPSAYIDVYDEDKILYQKIHAGTLEYFEYTTLNTSDLYNVTFTYVGEKLGDYAIKEVIATGTIYTYVGEKLGNYNPVTQLNAPNKLQSFVVKTSYKPSHKTVLNMETALSNYDQNLFSSLGDATNKGLATKIGWEQLLIEKKWQLKSTVFFDYLNKNFTSIERIQPIEFNRDWNIENTVGTQKLVNSSLHFSSKKSRVVYTFENLEFSNAFSGNKHQLVGKIQHKNIKIQFNNSILNSQAIAENSVFSRNYLTVKNQFKKGWYGAFLNTENNKKTNNNTQTITPYSHKFQEYEAFFGLGDSTHVFSQVGVNFSATDSILNTKFKQVNTSKTYYLKSTFINSNTSKLNTYINYRTVNNVNFDDENTLNSKLYYQQQLFNQLLIFNTSYQTLSGNLPQQDYTYLKTEIGQGYYTWVDYNNNNIKEMNEFEVAQFQDQANYLRVILPTIKYLATHQNKFTQSLILNPQQWSVQQGFQKFISKFYNQTAILIDNKQLKQKKFNLNPFNTSNNNIIGLQYNFTNSFYFNRGKKHYSTTYNYTKSEHKNTTTIDDLYNFMKIHKLTFEHQLTNFWQFNFEVSTAKNSLTSLNYVNRNYQLKNETISPKISYYYNDDIFISVDYELKNNENTIGEFEALTLQRIGFQSNYAKKDHVLKAEFNMYNNAFQGNYLSPVGYQMLQGLQPGNNYTWSFLYYKKLNAFLNLNIHYLGRKSDASKTIHTGSIQLKALF